MFTRILLTAVVGVASVGAYAQNPGDVKPDNTKVNQRDRNASEPTADQSKNNKSDVNLAKDVRRAIMDDKSLSTYAHNVKVIAEHGQITLKGPVHTEEERKTIEAKAVEVAGAGKVTNQIEVKPDTKASR